MISSRNFARALAIFAVMIAALLRTTSASAHIVGISQSDFTLEQDGRVRARIVFSKADAVRLGAMDRDHDEIISAAEVAGSAAVFRDAITNGVVVRADDTPCVPTLEGGDDTEGDGFGLSVVFACRARPKRLDVELSLLDQLPAGHRHVLRIGAEQTSIQKLLVGTDRSASLTVPRERSLPNGAVDMRESVFGPTLLGALKMGVEHILTGWDHLLFLAAVLLGTRQLRGVVAAVSAFTLAHSITLAVAALGLYAPSPLVVEPAIAASIAFVAFENAIRPRPTHRWRITFAFGLVHGFGFAGALRELTLPRERLVPTLLGFNLGVEAGQLALVLLAVPLLARLRDHDAFERYWIRRGSVVIGVVGAGLCVARIARR